MKWPRRWMGYRRVVCLPKAKVTIMVLDSATTGRMAVLYYRNMDKELVFGPADSAGIPPVYGCIGTRKDERR